MKFRVLFIIWSCLFCLADNNCCFSMGSDGLATELKSMEKDIPLPYHSDLDKTVKQLSNKTLPKTFTKYEAFIDSVLIQRGMPLELKYLPYALSGMKANYDFDDRCGYWALPTLVSLHYGLNINIYRDERWSVRASTLAALDYLNDLYNKYNDWWYSILAYANSPTSLSHALIHYGSKPELWDFYDNRLMPDTRVIADFIACVYLGNKHKLNFNAKAVEPSIVKIPEPKQPKIPAPPMDTSATTAHDPIIGQNNTTTKPTNGPSVNSRTIKYKVKKGDTLTKIASKYHVSVANLKKWNNLKTDRIREGQTLTIQKK